MLKSLVNKKGSSFTIVLTVLCVTTVIGIALINAAVQGLRDNKLQSEMDYAYYAGESAIERCFDSIQGNCVSADYTAKIKYDGNNLNFVNGYIDEICNDTKVSKNFLKSNAIDVGDGSKAEVTIHIPKNPLFNERDGKLTIELGLKAEVNYKNTGYKMVYAQKQIVVILPSRYKLETAVNTIGDLMVCGNISATITGDAIVYGTSPEKKNENNQYYYGGIYSRSNSKLKIDGYALSRSFIRVGPYNNIPDNSRIDITKDAIAKCIQVFGKNDELIVRRNAYTTDDLEMNGENSIIAVNGSYFGLSEGDAINHDSSSAIVNSAPVHFGYSPESLLSRIVINGDVFINGATFKLEGGSAKGKIENSSILWDKVANKPYYKSYSGLWTQYNDKLKEDYEAHSSLYSGFLNLFQVWDTVDAESDQKIEDWIGYIKACRLPEGNKLPDASLKTKLPLTITGLCKNCMAANDRLYLFNQGAVTQSDIVFDSLLDKYDVPEPISDVKNIKNFWIDRKEPGNPSSTPWYGYWYEKMPGKLGELKGYLTKCCENLVTRTDDGPGDTITHTFAASPDSTKGSNLFQYIVNMAVGAESYDPDSVEIFGGIRNLTSERVETLPKMDDKSHLIVNNDPLRTIVVDKEFRGIIISMGKVVVGRGASIWGSIIAAGRGFVNNGSFVGGSAADDTDHIPRVLSGGSNLGNLDNGDYAAVLITDIYNGQVFGSSTDETKIDFPGRDALLNSFTDTKLKEYLYSIF